MRFEGLTYTEKKWVFYKEQLRHLKEYMMKFDWSYFLSLKRGREGQFDAFTRRDDVGYKNRRKYTDWFLFKMRKGLRINNKKHLQYLALHEFGKRGFGHVHAVFHFNKELSECAVESVLRELAETERKRGYLICFQPDDEYEMKQHSDIKIRSKEKVCSYMTKVEKIRGCYYPLPKQHWHSNFLVKR